MLRDPQHDRKIINHFKSTPFVLSLPVLSKVEGSKDSESIFPQPAERSSIPVIDVSNLCNNSRRKCALLEFAQRLLNLGSRIHDERTVA